MKIKITQLLICSVLMMAGAVHAQEWTFVIPSASDLAEMSDDEKIEMFHEFDSLSSEERIETQKRIEAMPESESNALVSEYFRLVIDPRAEEARAQEAKASTPVVDTQTVVSESPSVVAILTVVIFILLIVIGLLIYYRKREDLPPADDLA